MIPHLELRRLQPDLLPAVRSYFAAVLAAGDDATFHPHPFTADEAEHRCRYAGADVYAALLLSGEMIGYGMLRGWDEGYKIPSLGVAIDSRHRGRGLANLMMEYLHAAARLRGASKVRLTVYPGNTAAVRLYERLGYTLYPSGRPDGRLIGFKELQGGSATPRSSHA